MQSTDDWPASRDETEMLEVVERRARQIRRRRLAFVPVTAAVAVAALIAVSAGGHGQPTTVQVGPASDAALKPPPPPGVPGAAVVKKVSGTTVVTAKKKVPGTTTTTAKNLSGTTVVTQLKTPGSSSTTVLKKPAPTDGTTTPPPPKPLPPPGDKTPPPTKPTLPPGTPSPPAAGISANKITPGTPLGIKAAGCTPATEAKAAWDGAIVATTTVEAGGWFVLSFTVPDTTTLGDHIAYVKCLTPDGSGFSMQWTVTVVASLPPPVFATIATGGDAIAGQPLGLKGSGFGPGAVITVALDGVTTLATTKTGGDGTFVVTVTIPASTPPGPHGISAVSSDAGAKIPITVLAAK